jgi:hypothetical protein
MRVSFLHSLAITAICFPLVGFGQGVKEVSAVLRSKILKEAAWAMHEQPLTVTASFCPRSAGGRHDFYSEGDYWWPDPENPGGPYIQRDGMTNPENFVDHRRAMVRLSQVIGSLASAYKLTGDDRYVFHASAHLRAWFVDTTSMMNPSLLYAQAISGRVTGRGIGIIDTIHLMEVAQGIKVMENASSMDKNLLIGIKSWFRVYLEWLVSHPYGKAEMNAENNHGTCWVMQVAAFASLLRDETTLQFCRDRYKNVLLPNQMAEDGSFPRELRRTKPYGYSLFNLDAMTMVCHILSDENNDLWDFTVENKNIRKGIDFLYPYVRDKKRWPYAKDVMYWDNWPIAHPFLVISACHFKQGEWFETWKSLDHNPVVEEVLRNLPVRNPLIWLNE